MNDSSKHCWTPSFSHVYVEEEAADSPIAKRVLERLPKAELIIIDDYRSLFNRLRQNHLVQRRGPKLILAKRTTDLTYRGSEKCQNYGFGDFHYATPMLNCPYDCDYCYLQAAHPSAHVVVFVNQEDFFAEVETKIEQRDDRSQPLFLSIAYSNDLLALEELTGICRQWIEFGRGRDDLVLEIRTKSTAFAAIEDLEPSSSVILSWTLTSDHVHEKYESRTPSPAHRLRAAKRAVEAGWRVRLCLDPIIPEANWRGDYGQLIDDAFETIDPETIEDIAAGVFRMSRDHYETIRRQRPDCGLFCSTRIERSRETVTFGKDLRHEVMTFISDRLSRYVDSNKVALWQ